jgi:hypothetical protein
VKNKLLFLITCTGIEIATATGITGYLMYLGESILALISGIVFAKLIVFHFIMDWYDKRSNAKSGKRTSSIRIRNM